MIITYIGHSGFFIELEQDYLLFDYYEGNLPTLSHNKNMYVFASHKHQDHYNPDVFLLLEKQNFPIMQIQGILSKDIYYKKIPENISYQHVKPGQEILLEHGIKIQTLKSTDSGVAFVVYTKEGTIYHAGDLNDWVWEGDTKANNHNMTANFRREIDKLKDVNIDVAFLPLDPHQEKDYARGFIYFLEHVKTKMAFPMHYWKQPEIIEKLETEYPQYKDIIQNTEMCTSIHITDQI